MTITSLLGWGSWFGFAAEYLAAGLLIAVGIYLVALLTANDATWWGRLLKPLLAPLRIVGFVLIGLGIALACITYGKTLGAEQCNAAWREKNYEAQVARLNQQLDAKAAAAKAAQDSLKEIATEKEQSDAAVTDYQVAVAHLEDSLAACRRARADDDRRMCSIIGATAPGCGNSR